MSKLVQCLLTVLFLTVPVGRGVVAGEPAKPIRALLVTGGCCHDYKHQKDLLTRGLSRRANIEWTIAYDPDTTTRHKNPIYDQPDWSKNFDVVIHDECSSDVNDMNVDRDHPPTPQEWPSRRSPSLRDAQLPHRGLEQASRDPLDAIHRPDLHGSRSTAADLGEVR